MHKSGVFGGTHRPAQTKRQFGRLNGLTTQRICGMNETQKIIHDLSLIETHIENVEKNLSALKARVASLLAFSKQVMVDVGEDRTTKAASSILIQDLPFSARAYGGLVSLGAVTLHDVTELSARNILRVPNVGRRTIVEIETVLAEEYGLRLKDGPSDYFMRVKRKSMDKTA